MHVNEQSSYTGILKSNTESSICIDHKYIQKVSHDSCTEAQWQIPIDCNQRFSEKYRSNPT